MNEPRTSESGKWDEIQPGARVTVRDARGRFLPRIAASSLERGHDFPIVWVAREEEWLAAKSEGRVPTCVPWPADDVEVADANEVAHTIARRATDEELDRAEADLPHGAHVTSLMADWERDA